ncbi:tetratricopeptide repeat protein [Rhodospirillaceae bacterium SYSU D60014]|uniref:tetratricopeptide repeat protein n=1 Tax=Virgifigura deserti TaxID=2268457 RepID=UPI000E673A1D
MYLLAAAFVLGLSGAAEAEFADGLTAYKRYDFAAALEEWQPLADHGDQVTQFYLGEMYRQAQGVSYDMTEASRWYRKAAEQGHAEAQFQLAEMYESGYGLDPDPAQAVQWLTRAAEGGHAAAMQRLGNRYATGEGVNQDLVQAHLWLALAATRGGDVVGFLAGTDLRRLLDRMSPAEISKANRLVEQWQPRPAAPANAASVG